MAYRNKQDTIAEAERLGIDVSGMSWPEMQKVVKVALEKERLGMSSPVEQRHEKIENPDRPSAITSTAKKARLKYHPLDARNYKFEPTVLAPELFPDQNRIIRYDEELGDDVEIEEKSFMGMEGKGQINYSTSRDYATGTYKIKGKTGRKVMAEASIPKENAGRYFNANKDWFEVVEFQGRRGYRYSQFKAALKRTGYFEDYRKALSREPNTFYLTGILCVDIPFAHHVMQEVEERVRYDREHGNEGRSRWGV